VNQYIIYFINSLLGEIEPVPHVESRYCPYLFFLNDGVSLRNCSPSIQFIHQAISSRQDIFKHCRCSSVWRNWDASRREFMSSWIQPGHPPTAWSQLWKTISLLPGSHLSDDSFSIDLTKE